MRASRHPKVVELLIDLWGSLRFDTGKLKVKSTGYGAPIEWRQDWAFYPHTNEDLAAVGIMIDDVDMENGPMMVVPGSHKGPIHDHHGRTDGSAARWIRRITTSTCRAPCRPASCSVPVLTARGTAH
jgi:ectoine hydroxylase-related dioxygenase (phytanoyl-CoA dioxygenase family)